MIDSTEYYQQTAPGSRTLLDSMSTQASGATERGMMYTYTLNSAPPSTPSPSRPIIYFWDEAPWVTRYVMMELAGLVLILCITIAAITLQHKCDSHHSSKVRRFRSKNFIASNMCLHQFVVVICIVHKLKHVIKK